ncbi:MAG: hypothetical protein R2755_09955 [Acidimicrobiales bacterium]
MRTNTACSRQATPRSCQRCNWAAITDSSSASSRQATTRGGTLRADPPPGWVRRPAAAPRGHGHHGGTGAVVGAQLHDLPAVEQLDQPVEEGGVGAVPPVDRLVGVTHRAQVTVRPEPRQQQFELQRVHVLELVDEEVAEAVALGLGEGRVGSERLGAALEQVVEVHQAAAPLGRFVVAEELLDERRVHRRGAAAAGQRCGSDRAGSNARAQSISMPTRTRVGPSTRRPAMRRRTARGPARATVPPGAGRASARAAARARSSGTFRRPAGPAGRAGAPGPALGRRLPGERDAQRPARVEVALGGAVGEAAGEHPGLAGAGARPDDQRL